MIQNILVVDNDIFMREIVSETLSKRGYQVLMAESGLGALDILKTFTPDIFFIDLIMPNINGKKLCELIRKNSKFKNAYVVVLSAVAAEEEMSLTEKDGVDACIAKGPVEEMNQNILNIIDQFNVEEKPKLLGKTFGVEAINARGITKELLSIRKHFETLLEKMHEGIMEINANGRIIYANPAAQSLTSLPEEEILGSLLDQLFISDDRERIAELLQNLPEKPNTINEDCPAILNDSKVTVDILPLDGEESTVIVILNNITEKKRVEAERERIIADLNDALARVKTLSGLLPICSHCKKIRNDKGYWKKIETYLMEYSDAIPTHSVCPECLKKHYPEYSD